MVPPYQTMQFLRSASLRPSSGMMTQKSWAGLTVNVSTNPCYRTWTGKLSLSSLKYASIAKNKGSNIPSLAVPSRNFHALLIRRTNRWTGSSHSNVTNGPIKKFPILHTQMGSISHFSSMFGGGGAKRPGGGNRVAQGVGLLGAGSVLLGKTKYLLAALKLTKLASLGSMLVTVGTYSMFFGWPYAIG